MPHSHYWLAPLLAAILWPATVVANNNVRQNEGNCVGVKSCRPRCITFGVDRTQPQCDLLQGVFAVEAKLNPWDIKRFGCLGCEGDACSQQDLAGDLTIRIGEEGHSGSLFSTSTFLPADEDQFTFCSIYPCTKDECALPEQLGFAIRFEFIPGDVGMDQEANSLLSMGIFLKAAFVGSPVLPDVENRYGPLSVVWMDDPAGCRDGDFSPYAPVAPDYFPVVTTDTTVLPQTLYCSGPEYAPLPLPETRQPTSTPSAAPSMSPVPTVLPTYSAIGLEQLQALEVFYNATEMFLASSMSRHNWFTISDYCDFTGVTCNGKGHVTSLDLSGRRLGGTIPPETANLSHLVVLKLVNNHIGGTIPPELWQLRELTLIELSSNLLTSSIPAELSELPRLRRLMLRNNKLNGTFPDALCQLEDLFAIDISHNVDIYGELPACIGDLPLEILRVQDVGLVGQVPPALCEERPFNGLDPNQLGCNAIACPAGTFEPTNGREDGGQHECMRCATESNVIGSTSCMLVDGNEIITMSPTTSLEPSSSPSQLPSVLPSATPLEPTTPSPTHKDQTPSPTSEPSSNPSLSPSLAPSSTPSLVTSSMPSDVPSFMPSSAPSTAPSTAPSSAPSTATVLASSSSIRVSVMFAHVSQVMTNATDIDTFETLTRDYLNNEGNDTLEVTKVEVVSQSLRIPRNETPVVTVMHPTRKRRLSESDGSNEVLFVQMQAEGTSSESFESQLTSLLEEESYVSALSEELDMFSYPVKVPDDAQLPSEESTEGSKRGINWWLLSASVTLSVVAIATVVMVRRRRRRYRRSMEALYGTDPRLEQQFDETALSPPRSAHITRQSPMSSPTFYGDYSYSRNGEEAMSEESSGGWKSEDSEEQEDRFVNANANSTIAAWAQNGELSLAMASSHPIQEELV